MVAKDAPDAPLGGGVHVRHRVLGGFQLDVPDTTDAPQE
jgi:hypothetical protein